MDNKKEEVINIKKCGNPGCEKDGKLRCPNCTKLKLEIGSYFCAQDCFKTYWGKHKLIHDEYGPIEDSFPYSGKLRPFKQEPKRKVPNKIMKPEYADSGIKLLKLGRSIEEESKKNGKYIPVYTSEEIEGIRAACKLGRYVLDEAHKIAKVGVRTDEIDVLVHELCIENDAYPSPLNYYDFPKSVCTSVNEVICHGIPDRRPLENGDILNIDISVYLKGYHADLNETYLIGEVDKDSKFLVENAYKSLEKAIEICKPGTLYREIGNVIGNYIESKGLSVVRTYCGHGVGKLFHTAPNVPHYKNNKAVGSMKVGHIFTIEPMINQGSWQDVTWNDNWTAVTVDGKRSAQFEHTILITEQGCEVLTARTPNSPPLEFLNNN